MDAKPGLEGSKHGCTLTPRRTCGESRGAVQPEPVCPPASCDSPYPRHSGSGTCSGLAKLEMSGVSPGQRGLRSKTSELFRDRGSNTSRLQRQDHHLVPPVPSLVTPDSNKPKRKLALWGRRRKSDSVSPSSSARPSGDSTNLLRKSGETSTSPYRAVQNLLTRWVHALPWRDIIAYLFQRG